MSTAVARGGHGGPAAAVPGVRGDDGSTLAVPAARGLMFVLLCGFASMQWMHLLEPVAYGRARYALGAAVLAMAGLLLAGRLSPRLRTPAAVLVAFAVAPLALLGGGVADELLRPDRWGDLAAAIGRGISSLPGARVPYRGLDEWTRTVLMLGGTTLSVAAALLAFWPRQHGELGFRYVALVLLLTLYAVPAVAVELGAEFLSGALLSVLVLGYLRLERLRITEAGAAGMLAGAVTILALVAAPVLDTDEPWFDYETWALSSASSKSTNFHWEHRYGPLDWPRDGRELLRVKARQPAYWKAMNLDDFDGHRWVRDEGASNLDGCEFGGVQLEQDRRRWLQRIQVSVRNLRSSTFVTAGIACAILAPRLAQLPLGDGTYATATRALRRGDAYGAIVYTPLPNERDRTTAGSYHPLVMQRHTRITLPGKLDPLTGAELNGNIVTFPLFDDRHGRPLAHPAGQRGPEEVPAERILAESSYSRTYALARRMRAASDSQEDFVQRVLRHLKRGYSYTESPPRAAESLDGFLFDARAGYCQQFSGAMTLLLRMGGVPARVSTGFTTGSFDRKAGEYVVRDLDAHSWVEVHYEGIGWVTFDPTPAAAPARSQPDEDTGGTAAAAAPSAPDLGGDIRSDPSRQVAIAEEGPPWTLIGLAAAAAIGALALAAWLLRRHRRRVAAGWGPLAELERALRRARRAPGPGTTLNAVEAAFGRSPAAARYVRAIRDQRYAGRPAVPSPRGRRAVRSELGRGGGLSGRLRAWWAMPPKPR